MADKKMKLAVVLSGLDLLAVEEGRRKRQSKKLTRNYTKWVKS